LQRKAKEETPFFIETPHRLLDVQLGRFVQADKLVDLFTGITPYVYAYNNPIKFNDPTGLCTDCATDENDFTDLAEKYAVKASRTGNGISMWDLASSHNPIYRNIGLHHQRGDNNYVHRSLHGQANISAGGVAPQSKWHQDFRNAFGLALNYGLGGTLIAIYGAPILADMLMADGAMDLASIAYDVATGDYVSAGIDAVALAVPGVNAVELKIIPKDIIAGYLTKGTMLLEDGNMIFNITHSYYKKGIKPMPARLNLKEQATILENFSVSQGANKITINGLLLQNDRYKNSAFIGRAAKMVGYEILSSSPKSFTVSKILK
jgi:RHS repeat-associated protein